MSWQYRRPDVTESRTALFDALADRPTISYIVAEYDGSGDDGSINDITILAGT